MKPVKQLALVFATLGIFAGFAYWLFLYYRDRDNAPSVSDFWQTIQSYFRRGALTVTSITTGTIGEEDYIDRAVRIIANFEGFSPKVYPDAGHSAIGYGHDIVPGDGFDAESTISESDAYALLRSDVEARSTVLGLVTVELSDNQKAALLSLIYNIGNSAFSASTMLRLINAGNLDGAADEFSRWVHSQGEVNQTLVLRREQEQTLFNS